MLDIGHNNRVSERQSAGFAGDTFRPPTSVQNDTFLSPFPQQRLAPGRGGIDAVAVQPLGGEREISGTFL